MHSRSLVASAEGLIWCVSVDSTSLTDTYGVESYHSNFSSHVYPSWLVTWVDVVGGHYKIQGR